MDLTYNYFIYKYKYNYMIIMDYFYVKHFLNILAFMAGKGSISGMNKEVPVPLSVSSMIIKIIARW